MIGVLVVAAYFAITNLTSQAPEEEESLEIIPHSYNDLNWWDLPWELSELADLITHMIEIDRYPNRHMVIGSEGFHAVAEYLIATFNNYEIDLDYYGTYETLIGKQEGYGSDNRAIVFGAYLDTDDFIPWTTLENAGSVAAVALIAEILSYYRLPIDIYYCFYSHSKTGDRTPDGELVPNLFGAEETAQYMSNNGVDIMALYNFEGVLLSDEGLLAQYDADADYYSGRFLGEVLNSFLLHDGLDILTTEIKGFELNDQLPFLDRGFPAINIQNAEAVNPDEPPNDNMYSADYNLDYVTALAQASAAAAIYLSLSGNGEEIKHRLVAELEPNQSAATWAPFSYSQRVEVSMTQNSTMDIRASLGTMELLLHGQNDSSVFSEDSGTGARRLMMQNIGNESAKVEIVFTYNADFDGDMIFDSVQYSWPDPSPALDWDEDGLSDQGEILAGTDIFEEDTDMDNMLDGYEVAFGLDPLRNDVQEDLDQDGLTNAREHSLGTFPNSTDTDRDSMDDLWEVVYLTDPFTNDTQDDLDNDTLTNLEEYLYGADPRSIDGDHDGVLDAEEVARGMNALSADSDGDGLRDQLELIEGLDPLVPDYDVDFSPDGSDHNPRINSIIMILLFSLVPVTIGSIFFWRRFKK
jgi:hypothetical protein